MFTLKRWVAVYAAGWIAWAASGGCSDPRGSAEPAPSEQEDGADAAVEGGVDGSLSASPDAGDPRLTCPTTRELESTLAFCLDTVVDGAPCEPNDRCIKYQRPRTPEESLAVCDATCGGPLPEPTWVLTCTSACNYACGEPPAQATVFELDVSDCARRSLTSCAEGALALTLQAQLDAQLRSVIPVDVAFAELRDDTLVVDFENGCPARVYSKAQGGPLPRIEQLARAALADVRLSCAIALDCGEVLGPSTIATP